MKRRIQDHPLLAFVLLAFGFSYLAGGPALFAVQAWLPHAPELVRTYLGRLLVVAGPAVAALTVTGAASGRRGVSALLGGFRFRRSHWLWWPILPLVSLGVAVAAHLCAGLSLREQWAILARGWPVLAAHYVLQVLVIGVGEETGWRGFFLPGLLRRHSPLAASGIVALVWGLWHGPAYLAGGWDALSLLATVCALSLVFTDLWSRTRGSIAILALAHGSFNAPLFFFEAFAAPRQALTARLVTVGLYAALAAALLVRRWSWWLRGPSPEPAGPDDAPFATET